MKIYSIQESEFGGMNIIHCLDEDGTETWIPEDESNPDYQAYLAYLAEQETAK